MREVFIGIADDGAREIAGAIATDREGRELARLEASAGGLRGTDPAATAAALADLTDRVLHAAGLAPPATSICCVLPSAASARDRLALAAALQREAIAERIRVLTQAESASSDDPATTTLDIARSAAALAREFWNHV